MSNKSSDKKQTKLRGERWQDKRFFLTKKYKDGLREMIWSRRRLSGKAQHVGLRILDRFASTPTIFANLEKLAGECDMSRPTLRRYLQELSKAGLFRFDTPPYWRRKSGHATEIHFPTKAVEKWLRDNGFFMTMERNLPWSKAEKVNKTGVSPSAKLQKTPSTMERNLPTSQDEVASAPRSATAAKAAASLAPCDKERKASAEASGLGAKYDDDNGKAKWFAATTERPFTIPSRFPLGQRVGCNAVETLAAVLGFGTHSRTASKLLVKWDDEASPGWMSYEELRPVTAEPVALGGPLKGDDWFPATTVRPENVPPDFVIDAIVGVTIEGYELDWDDDYWSWSDGIEPRGKIVRVFKRPRDGWLCACRSAEGRGGRFLVDARQILAVRRRDCFGR